MSLRVYLKKLLPAKELFQSHKSLRPLIHWLHDPKIWHFTCRSSASGVAIGLFWAMMPLPMQTLCAALVALWLRANLPLSVIFVWVTNPITATPIYYLAYKLGSVSLNQPIQQISFELSTMWFTNTLTTIWQPLVVGCLLLGICSATLGNITIQVLWRLLLLRKKRHNRSAD